MEPERIVKANHVENGDSAWLAAAARAENVEGKFVPLLHQRPMASTGRGVRELGLMHAAHCISCKERIQVLVRVTGVHVRQQAGECGSNQRAATEAGAGGTDVLCNGS